LAENGSSIGIFMGVKRKHFVSEFRLYCTSGRYLVLYGIRKLLTDSKVEMRVGIQRRFLCIAGLYHLPSNTLKHDYSNIQYNALTLS